MAPICSAAAGLSQEHGGVHRQQWGRGDVNRGRSGGSQTVNSQTTVERD